MAHLVLVNHTALNKKLKKQLYLIELLVVVFVPKLSKVLQHQLVCIKLCTNTVILTV